MISKYSIKRIERCLEKRGFNNIHGSRSFKKGGFVGCVTFRFLKNDIGYYLETNAYNYGLLNWHIRLRDIFNSEGNFIKAEFNTIKQCINWLLKVQQ